MVQTVRIKLAVDEKNGFIISWISTGPAGQNAVMTACIHEDNYVAVTYCSVVYECTYYNSTVIYT